MILETFSLLALTAIIGVVILWAFKAKRDTVQDLQEPIGRMRLRPEDDEDDKDNIEEKHVTRKEASKLAKKEEKKKLQASRRAAMEEQNKRIEEKNQVWLKKQEEDEQKELEEELRLKKIQEEKLKKEEEEYAQWKNLLAVESVGEEIQEESFTLDKFLEYIKLRKVVMIEDLASAFNLDGKTTVTRIHDLEKSGYLTGILDDRGKYVYITNEEFLSFKKYLEARGRVTRLELCNEGNRLIRLNPTPEDKAKIEAEERTNAEHEAGKL
jgi:DDRGK domain-containing protein 1